MGRGHEGSFAIVLGQHILPLTSNGEMSNHTPALTPTTHGKQSQRVTRGQKHQHSLAFIIHCPRYPCPAPGALRLPCPSIADGRPIHRPVASRGDDALTAAGPCDATAEISSQAASAVLRLPWIPASASRGAPDDPCPAGGPTFGTHHLRCIMNLPSRRAAGLSQGGGPAAFRTAIRATSQTASCPVCDARRGGKQVRARCGTHVWIRKGLLGQGRQSLTAHALHWC